MLLAAAIQYCLRQRNTILARGGNTMLPAAALQCCLRKHYTTACGSAIQYLHGAAIQQCCLRQQYIIAAAIRYEQRAAIQCLWKRNSILAICCNCLRQRNTILADGKHTILLAAAQYKTGQRFQYNIACGNAIRQHPEQQCNIACGSAKHCWRTAI